MTVAFRARETPRRRETQAVCPFTFPSLPACVKLGVMFHPKGPSFFELARQALSSTERGYDLLAPKFDYTPFRTPQWLLDAVAEPLREMGPFRSGLDLCCGTGAAIQILRPL